MQQTCGENHLTLQFIKLAGKEWADDLLTASYQSTID